jgi:hypothetical protein
MISSTRSAFRDLPSEPLAGTRPRNNFRIALLVWVLCLVVYNANMREIGAADSFPARFLPFGIWRYRTLALDPIAHITAQGRKIDVPPGEAGGKAYWLVRGIHGQVISLYPIAIPVLLAPLYAPAVYYLDAKGWEQWRLDWLARMMEKLSASLIAATSAALLYLALRRRVETRMALLLTFAYAFATTTWMIGSQALWQHGLTELLIAGALWVVTGPRTTRAVVATGLACGLMACNRPPDSLLAAAIGLYGLCWAGRKAPWLVLSAVAPVLLLMTYNLRIVGHWAGGYGLIGKTDSFAYNPVAGVLGLLLSPTRGLFVYSPFLLFVVVFAGRIWRDRESRFLSVAMGAAILLQLALYAKLDWRQGASWGPRWLTSALPMLVWMLVPVLRGLRRVGWALFLMGCLAGAAIEGVGAFWYTGVSNAAVCDLPAGQGGLRAAWSPRNSPFLAELRHPAAVAELTTAVRGSLEIARADDGEALSMASGKPLHIEGWALADGRTPSEVLIMLDGQMVGSTREFFARPDVTKAPGVPFASGWRLKLPARPIEPGAHLLAVMVRAFERGNVIFLVDHKFTISAAGTANPEMRARQAAEAIAAHQQGPGYWLTTFTKGTLYREPQGELNTFLNAVMTDLLAPVAEEAGLGESVRRVRRYLTAQIEEDGLVRYHGRLEPADIGKLGCVITPDSDDTALVWRVAPPADRKRLAPALATLRQYRTPEGLYRTWLATREHYQCLDPGANPNPPDIGIQMHVFMMLAKEDPPAARALCRALGKQVKDELWVYYRSAPLVPLLRQAELHNAGCDIQLAPTALTRIAEGQQIWVTAVQYLDRFARKGARRPAAAEVSELLGTMSRDSFALVRQTPPLLFHNDQTATVPRYYWSEDAGYAIWLRLYFENQRARSAH